MTDDLVKRLRAIDHMSVEDCFLQSPYFTKAADRIEALEQRLDVTKDKAEAVIIDLMSKLEKAAEALRGLIQHAHNCEKELTEKLHHQDFCGESLPLTNARATLAEIEGGKDD